MTLEHARGRAGQVMASSARVGRRSAILGALLLAASAVSVWATTNTPPRWTSLTTSAGVIDEGQSITITGSFVDPDAKDTHTILIYWQGSTLPNYEDPY